MTLLVRRGSLHVDGDGAGLCLASARWIVHFTLVRIFVASVESVDGVRSATEARCARRLWWEGGAGPHTGPADRKTPPRVRRAEQHAARQRLASTSSEVHSLVSIDLLGRTGRARLRLRVRFAVTDDSANVERWPGRAGLDLWKGGIE